MTLVSVSCSSLFVKCEVCDGSVQVQWTNRPRRNKFGLPLHRLSSTDRAAAPLLQGRANIGRQPMKSSTSSRLASKRWEGAMFVGLSGVSFEEDENSLSCVLGGGIVTGARLRDCRVEKRCDIYTGASLRDCRVEKRCNTYTIASTIQLGGLICDLTTHNRVLASSSGS